MVYRGLKPPCNRGKCVLVLSEVEGEKQETHLSKIGGTVKYLVKKSLVGRTEEKKDKQMTRNFIGDYKTLLNILCPVRNNRE